MKVSLCSQKEPSCYTQKVLNICKKKVLGVHKLRLSPCLFIPSPVFSSVLCLHPALAWPRVSSALLSWALHLAPECSDAQSVAYSSTILVSWAKMNTDIPSPTETRLDKECREEKAADPLCMS